MKITSVSIENYKSFAGPTTVEFGAGFNVVVGRNNVGKTALLEAIVGRPQRRPHRSLLSQPTRTTPLKPEPRVRLNVSISGPELDLVLSEGDVGIPMPVNVGADPSFALQALMTLVSSREIAFSIQRTAETEIPGPLQTPYQAVDDGSQLLAHVLRRGPRAYSVVHFNGRDRLEAHLATRLHEVAYLFRAERLSIGRAQVGATQTLAANAHNLPEVLTVLQSNPARFDAYVALVRRVLPTVTQVTVPPVGGADVEIRIWEHDPGTQRDDLAIPLSEGGTGLSQVLAMLYVLVTAETGRVFVIDEPNSFLHPGAVRALLNIFREHPHHQYIISTHSPQVIAALPDDTRILIVEKGEEFATRVRPVDAGEATGARAVLDSVGARLSDVFGAEAVLWVEGPTEEKCFEFLRRAALEHLRPEVLIRGVVHTGDFNRKTAALVTRVYERLSGASPLVPPAVGFLLDREALTPKEVEDLERRSKGKLTVLPVRMYECYLLDAEAIAACLRAREEANVTTEAVQRRLEEELGGLAPADADAASILQGLFRELTENRREYRKVEDGLTMTRWLHDHRRASLEPLVKVLTEKLSEPNKGASR